ncbi:MAG: HEPN domain-containing protein [Ginsengibacter sp.]
MMKSSLSHLPQMKQEQILQIAEIIKEVASPEKIILFGSYAKGNYVEHRYTGKDGITYEYISDFDFLVVTQQNKIKDYELEDIILNKTQQFKVPINVQIHEIDYINKGLQFGQYFFTDIVKEGILLYDTNTLQFANLTEISTKQLKEISNNYFTIWFNRHNEFFIDARNAYDRKSYTKAAFELHQATESLYYVVLLVFQGYKPKSHNLYKLRKYSKQLSEELYLVFPVENDTMEKKIFDLLKSGYIDARYKEDFHVTKEEIEKIMDRVTIMRNLVEKICNEKISSYS